MNNHYNYVQNIDIERNVNEHEIESSITHRVLSKTPSPLNESNMKSTTYNTKVNFMKTENDYYTTQPINK